MKKRKFLALLGALVVSTNLYAYDVGSIASSPNPPSGTKLISSARLKKDYDAKGNVKSYAFDRFGAEDGKRYLSMGNDSYKVITYNAKTNEITYSKTETSKDTEGNTSSLLTLETAASIDEAISNATVNTKGESCIVPDDKEVYVLFVKEGNAEPSYVVQLKNLTKYVEDENAIINDLYGKKLNKDSKVSLSLVTPITTGDGLVIGATYKLDYDLKPFTMQGEEIEESAFELNIDNGFYAVALDGKAEGSITFDLDSIENKEYTYCVETVGGNKYEGKFKVDFCNTENTEDVDLNAPKPKVTFEGMPKTAAANTPVVLKMKTDGGKCQMSFNGQMLGNGLYSNSFDVTVYQNGVYDYICVNKAGKATEGTLEVTCFSEDKAAKLDATSLDLDTSQNSGLAKTGINRNNFLPISILVFLVGLVCLLYGLKQQKKKGGNIDAK